MAALFEGGALAIVFLGERILPAKGVFELRFRTAFSNCETPLNVFQKRLSKTPFEDAFRQRLSKTPLLHNSKR
jgi:hypothetical protein